jgi:hypothetical protein
MFPLLALMLTLVQGAKPSIDSFAIGGITSCPKCRLERTGVITLDRDYAVRPGNVAIVGSEVVLVSDGGPNPILRFDLRTGKYLGDVGRKGRGPGEFTWPRFLTALPGDSLFVFDNNGLTFSLLAPRTYRYVRGAPVTVSRPSAAILNGTTGLLWVAASVARAQQVGYPIHLFEQDGTWIKSVGTERPLLRWNRHMTFTRRLAAGPNGTIWSIPRYGPLAIEVFDRSGHPLRKATYSAEWVPEQRQPQRRGDPPLPERPPFAVVSDSEAWILTLIPAAKWKQGIIMTNDPTHGNAAPLVGDVSKLFDTIVEVFDLVRRRVLLRVRLDEAVLHALPDGMFVVYREDIKGAPEVRLERWSVRGLP